MSEQYANATCLSCLLDTRRELEPIPEPFRLQQGVTFRVTLSAYTEYILSLPDGAKTRLMTRLDTLKGLASTRSPKLYNHFLRDISVAILKEISYAEEYHSVASVILPASTGDNVVAVSYLLDMYSGVNDNIEHGVREMLESFQYGLPKTISSDNRNLFNLAIILYRLSLIHSTVKEMHFLYDANK